MAESSSIGVEVVRETETGITTQSVRLAPGATVAEALAAVGHPEQGAHAEVGIFGIRVTRETALADGDRVEIYRAIQCDPKAMRRQRAAERA